MPTFPQPLRAGTAVCALLLTLLHPAGVAGELPPAGEDPVRLSPADEQGRYRFLVEFDEPGLLQRLPQDSARGPELADPAVRAARDRLMAGQRDRLDAIAAAIGRTPEVSHHFLVTESALGMRLSQAEAERVRELPGIAAVARERVYDLATFRGPWFIGADRVWSGEATPDELPADGAGMVLAVLDTGISLGHPSFVDDPECGHAGDGSPGKVLSLLDCSSTDDGTSLGLCNGPVPGDANGHGSHVAATAVGNRVGADAIPAPQPPGAYDNVSGVAPCARIRSYKTCPGSTCPEFNLRAGLSSVLIHGDVDVVNYSISGGLSPWNDLDRRKLDLVESGVLVAAAAGNTGLAFPTPARNVNHRGPWVLSVAAASHDETPLPVLSAAAPAPVLPGLERLLLFPGSDSPAGSPVTDLPVRHFDQQPPDAEACSGAAPALPDGFFDGAAALVRRGTCPFTEKIANAFDAGAELVLVVNDEEGILNMDTAGAPSVPAYGIARDLGAPLIGFVDGHPGAATVHFDPQGRVPDLLADFSLRGPMHAPLQHLTKPDVAAPGIDIYAAVPGGFAFISGTSMASPHAAGAALLVRQVHPQWSVSKVISALMTTANSAGTADDGAGPWNWDDVGSGRIDVARAVRAGLVLDETPAAYLAADPAAGGEVRTLNRPALRDVACTPDCGWTRTVTAAVDEAVAWQVEFEQPPGFEIEAEPTAFTVPAAGETRELSFTAAPLPGEDGAEIRYGRVLLHPDRDDLPTLHFSVAVRGEAPPQVPVADIAPAALAATLEPDSQTQEILTIGNLGNQPLDWSLASGAPDWLQLAPASGTVAPESVQSVTATFDSAGLEPETHTAALQLVTNDPDAATVEVPVTLTVIEPVVEADLVLSMAAGADFVALGEELAYILEVRNLGPRDAAGVTVTSALTTGLADVHWICLPGTGADCPAAGSGEIVEEVDLDAGGLLEFHVSGVLVDAGAEEQITGSALAVAPDHLPDPNPGNNLAQVSVRSGIFADAFE